MTTPICDFIDRYAGSARVRMHMPGHKGAGLTGCEAWDLTEVGGADSLYDPQGIIQESEGNARGLFGAAATLYSTEGSSQCIRAMLYLCALAFWEKRPGERPTILAGRNAHKAFLSACALLDLDVAWLFPESNGYSLCRCDIPPGQLEEALGRAPQAAGVYVTSPDYLGNTAGIPALAQAARRRGVPLLVDQAHGAYRRFLSPSLHALDQGADICCDSAHKTLPVLTGGAYLHIAPSAPPVFRARAREAMALFGSTSPSYLILRSLDRANRVLAEGYPERLAETAGRVGALRRRLGGRGWRFLGDEPLKLTLDAKGYGYTGGQVGAYLESRGVVCEYADPDYTVLMPTPENTEGDLSRLEAALSALERRPPLPTGPPPFQRPAFVMPLRRALFQASRRVPIGEAVGRTAASLAVSCPPAVSPVVPGERISENTADICRYYGIGQLQVLEREGGAAL